MLDIFLQVKSYLVLDKINVDNAVFRLHYKATFLILVSCSIILTARQYLDDSIACLSAAKVPQVAMNTYCWIHTTFSVYGVAVEEAMPHHGIGIASSNSNPTGMQAQGDDDGMQIRHHTYYQWTYFCLLFQALLFSLPRFLWSNWEGGLLETLTLDLGKPLQAKPDREKQVSLLAQYFRCKRRREHVTYTAKMMLCELLNLANVLGQLYLMDLFLGGHFATYGSDVFALTEQDARVRVDAMSRLFPKMTKCIFRKFGPSGTVEAIDALCVMPLNNANEKIYVFLWFWFVLLAVLSVAHLVLRVVVAVGLGRARALLLWTMMRLVKFNVVEDICKEHSFGDWLVLYQLAKNLDPLVCRELAVKLRSPNSVSANGIESGRRQDQSKGVVEDTAF